jgi:hypothetical protein
MEQLTDFTKFEFEHSAKRRTIFRQGSGPAVVVIHEIPGITPELARFARYIAKSGLTVYATSVRIPGKPATPAYAVSQIARACISREFHVLAEHRSSPIVDWLRALARRAYAEIGGKGVGVIGMSHRKFRVDNDARSLGRRTGTLATLAALSTYQTQSRARGLRRDSVYVGVKRCSDF